MHTSSEWLVNCRMTNVWRTHQISKLVSMMPPSLALKAYFTVSNYKIKLTENFKWFQCNDSVDSGYEINRQRLISLVYIKKIDSASFFNDNISERAQIKFTVNKIEQGTDSVQQRHDYYRDCVHTTESKNLSV